MAHDEFSGRNGSRPIFGLSFTTAHAEQIVAQICDGEIPVGTKLVVTANVDHIARLRHDEEFLGAYRRAWLRTIDGFPLFLYSRLRSAGVPERVTGADIFPQLVENLSPSRHRAFFVVSGDQTAEKLVEKMVASGFPRDAVKCVIPPFGFERDEHYSQALVGQVVDHGTTHLFFGVGCPKSEKWIDRHRSELGGLFAFAFGAGIDFYAGTAVRAPSMFRAIGMEWLWRLAAEPRRLAKRYLVDSWSFVAAVVDDMTARSPAPVRTLSTSDAAGKAKRD